MKLILKTLIIIAVVWGILKLMPAETKKAIGKKTGEVFSFIVPKQAREKLDPIFLSPAERRTKIISQLEKNIASIEEVFRTGETSSTMSAEKKEEALETIREAKNEIAKLNDANKDQGVVNRITSGVFQAAGDALGLSPKTPTSSSETAKNVVCSDG